MKKQKRTISVFKCWLTCQVASFEALLSIDKAIDDPPWSAVPFFASCRTKNEILQHFRIFLCFSYHIGGTCPVKEFPWSRNGVFVGTEKQATTHISESCPQWCLLPCVFEGFVKVCAHPLETMASTTNHVLLASLRSKCTQKKIYFNK